MIWCSCDENGPDLLCASDGLWHYPNFHEEHDHEDACPCKGGILQQECATQGCKLCSEQ